jgi:hypothetical protein
VKRCQSAESQNDNSVFVDRYFLFENNKSMIAPAPGVPSQRTLTIRVSTCKSL